MSSPKLIAYKAIIDFCSMMQDVVKNPDAIREASAAYAAGSSMTEIEIAKRNEALEIIAQAKSHTDDLQQNKDEFQIFYNEKSDELQKLHAQISATNDEAIRKLSEAQITMESALSIKKSAEESMDLANQKHEEISKREQKHTENVNAFVIEKSSIEKKILEIQSREEAVTLRENKIKEVFN